jgi:DNA-binding transcriptional ArsR family regulator
MIFNHMVKYQTQDTTTAKLDATFAALADSTRRAILARLAHGPTRVTDLAQPFAISLPAISKHLKVLERAGLLHRDKEGRIHRCSLVPAPMQEAASWIEKTRVFWHGRLDGLDRYLKKQQN